MGHHSEQRFSKYVSTLKEKEEGFAIRQSRRPRGIAQVYRQGKKARLAIRVKNLKQLNCTAAPNGSCYDILLTSSGDNTFRPVQIGVVEVDGRGEGQGQWYLAAENIMGTGRSLEDFDQILIAAKGTRIARSREKIILSGELELEVAEPFDGLNMEKVDPFGQAMPNHRWWKFYPNQFFSGSTAGSPGDHPVTEQPPEPRYVELNKPGIGTGPVFRGHQLIGLHYDEKGAVSCLVHGIPGRFCAEDQPDGGTSGYVYWQPLPGQGYQEGHYGYWLVHIDPESGEVVYPRQETPPPGRNPFMTEAKD